MSITISKKESQVSFERANLEVTEEARQMLQDFELFKSSALQWHQNIADDISFITPGGMWTEEQIRALKLRGQAPIEIPVIDPQIELQKSQIVGNAPSFKVLPRTDTDVEKAKLFAELCSYVWYQNDANMAVDETVKFQLQGGKGYFYVYFDPYGDDGYGLPIIESLQPFDVAPDPNSRRPDEEDSVCKFVWKYVLKKYAMQLFPQHADLIEKLAPDQGEMKFISQYINTQDVELYDNIAVNLEDNTILYLVRQTKIQVKYVIVRYKDQQGNIIERELTEDEFANFTEAVANDPNVELMADSIDGKEIYKTRIRQDIMLGNQIIATETLPTRYYTVIPVPYVHNGNPYTISLTRKMKGLQQEVNYRRSLMIAHATASTNAKVFLPMGSVADPKKLEVDWAKPNALIEYDPSFGKPEIVQPVPLPNAHYQLEMMAKQDAEFIAGTFRLSHGDSSAAPQTKGATQMIDYMGTRRTSGVTRSLYHAINILGKVILNFIQAYMKEDRVIRIVNPYDPYEEEMIQIGLGDIVGDETIKSLGDPSVGQYDLVVQAGSMAPTNRYAELEYYMGLVERGIIDRVEVLKKVDLFDRKGVLERMDETKNLTSQLEQANQVINDQATGIKRLEEDMIRLRRESIASKEQAKYTSLETDLKDRYNRQLLRVQELIDELELAKTAIKAGVKSKEPDTRTPARRE